MEDGWMEHKLENKVKYREEETVPLGGETSEGGTVWRKYVREICPGSRNVLLPPFMAFMA